MSMGGRKRKDDGGYNVTGKVVDYWGSYFIKTYGRERDEYYKRRGFKVMPQPKNLVVPKENGIRVEPNKRVVVRVVESDPQNGISLDDAVVKVERMLKNGCW